MSGGPGPNAAKPKVVLLHGLLRGAGSMRSLARQVRLLTGCEVFSISYPSHQAPLEELARIAASRVRDAVGHDNTEPVFAVTHSMGAVVLRHMQLLPTDERPRWCGTCMLAPPSNGSAVSRQLLRTPGVRWLYRAVCGPAAVQLGAPRHHIDASWPAPPEPYGIILGDVSLSLLNPTSWMTNAFAMLPKDNDGTLCRDDVLLPSSIHVASVPANHSFIMSHPHTASLVASFITHGAFIEPFIEP